MEQMEAYQKESASERKLGDLPPSDDKFWQYAEKIPTENKVVQDARTCQHQFRGEGNNVQCQNCYWGFYLTGETELKDGHVYNVKTGERII